VDADGFLTLIYTGVGQAGETKRQTQCLAFSEDVIRFQKHPGNPVIMPPEGCKHDDFRDPKVWRHENAWYMICDANLHDCGSQTVPRV
jgi:beta-fructofuranosidase